MFPHLLLLLVVLVPAGLGCALAQASPISIEVQARALVPGEPLRVDAQVLEPLTRLEGELLGREIFMVRSGSGPDGGERWSGWSMVALDQEPGPATVSLHGTSAGGLEVEGTLGIVIEAKTFPEERLEVEPRYVEPPAAVQKRIERERKKLDALYRARRAEAPPDAPFVRPVPGQPTSIFGLRRIYNGEPRSPHPGLDLRAASGTPVVASGPGRVVLAEELYYSGNTVILDHGGGLFTIYAHLSRTLVREGETAAAGQRIALSGATGRVTGPHLHWGAKIGDLPFDPTALLDSTLFR